MMSERLNKPGAVSVRPAIMLSRHPLLLLAMTACQVAAANPVWKKDLASPSPGSFPPIPSSILDFQVSWKGIINSGKVRMEFAPIEAKKPGVLVVRSSATSLGPAAAFYPYQANSWVELDPATLKPRFCHSVETDKSETVITTSRYLKNSMECHETTTPNGKQTGVTKDRTFTFSPIFEIFSAILHVRSQKLADGDTIHLVVHPFNNPYLLHVKVLGHEKHLDRKTIRLSVGMRKIDRETFELKAYKKIKRDATLWLSDDADRIPVELRAAVFVGDIRATITGFRKL